MTATRQTPATKLHPLIHLELDPAAFSTDWRHCDLIANYLARLASFDREDTFFYSNLLSTILNELLEIVFFEHHSEGKVTCSLLRNGSVDRIELLIPVDADRRAFYDRSVAEAQSSQASEIYTRALLGEDSSRRALGLLELASDYGAVVSLDQGPPEERLRLAVEVRLDQPAPRNQPLSK